jgi:hypothetical protein
MSLLRDNKVLYGKHVAIKKWFTAKWIGALLENKCFQKAKEKWYTYMICEIAKSIKKDGKEVKNTLSMDYHRKRWFNEIGEVSYAIGAEKELRSIILLKL